MMLSARYWKPRLAVLAVAMSLLSSCGADGSDVAGSHACPPVVEYDADLQARAAEDVQALPNGSTLNKLMSDSP